MGPRQFICASQAAMVPLGRIPPPYLFAFLVFWQVGDEIEKFIKFIDNPRLKYTLLVGKREMGLIMKDISAGVVDGNGGRY